MYMHIALTTGEKVVEYCHFGRYAVVDGVLTVTANDNTGERVHYPLVNIIKFELKQER